MTYLQKQAKIQAKTTEISQALSLETRPGSNQICLPLLSYKTRHTAALPYLELAQGLYMSVRRLYSYALNGSKYKKMKQYLVNKI